MKVTEISILIICFCEGNCNSRRSSFAENTEQIPFKEIFFLKTKQNNTQTPDFPTQAATTTIHREKI